MKTSIRILKQLSGLQGFLVSVNVLLPWSLGSILWHPSLVITSIYGVAIASFIPSGAESSPKSSNYQKEACVHVLQKQVLQGT